MKKRELIAVAVVLAVGFLAALYIGFSAKKPSSSGHDAHGHGHGHGHGDGHDHSAEKGPHGGKVLTEGKFELEVVLHAKGGPPHFRMFPSYGHKPVNPKDVTLTMELERLGGKTDTLQFRPGGDFLFSGEDFPEPHSFFIKITGQYKDEKFEWEYSQYEDRLTLAPELADKMGIKSEIAGPQSILSTLELPGEIAFNADMVSHVVPRVPGLVQEARKNLGDPVKKDEILAIIDSRELGEARSKYLVALEREKLARYNFERSQRLWDSKTISEKEHLTAQKTFLEEQIELKAAARKLMALGLGERDLQGLAEDSHPNLTHFIIRAPFDGVVVRKHLSRGEWVKEDAEIYMIADLSTVWVEITVYAKDLQSVRLNDKAVVKADSADMRASDEVSYIGPLLGEETRSAKARVVIPNTDGCWRPGLFVKVALERESTEVPVAVRNDAVQTYKNRPVVFFQNEDQYEPRPIVTGKSDANYTEVLKGISAGERYVTVNSYVLKAELAKAGLAHEH